MKGGIIKAKQSRRENLALGCLLLVSLFLRLVIVFRGGQFYWPDENRYRVSRAVAAHWRHAEWLAGLRDLFATADHLLFKVVCVVPALLESVTVQDPRIGAAFLALFSTANIAWVWRIALRASGDPDEAWAAAFLTACATTLFYYTRHLFPYDVSLFFLLGGVHAGLRRGWRPALAAGSWISLGFIAYNGYWQASGAILLVLAVAFTSGWRERAARAAAILAGLALPLLLVLGIGRALKLDLLTSYLEFSKTANVGNTDLGWRFILEDLWAADHGLALLWGGASLAACAWIVSGRAESRMRWWLCISVLTFGAMWALSDLAHKFVINARTVRCIVPFLCLTTAAAFSHLRRLALPRWLFPLILAGAGVQAVVNFLPPLTQVFPEQFMVAGRRIVAAAPFEQRLNIRIQNAFYLHYPDQATPLPADTEAVLLERPHPLQFVPYLYEGFIRAHRERFRKEDLAMRVLWLRSSDQRLRAKERFDRYTGPLVLTLQLPRVFPTRPEPVLTTGEPQAGDFINIVYEAPTQIRIVFDQWAYGGPSSASIRIDPTLPLEIAVSIGSLYPAADRFPALGLDPRLKHYLWVRVAGTVVLSAPQNSWPSSPESVTVAENWIGGTTTLPFFTGKVLQVENLPLGAVTLH